MSVTPVLVTTKPSTRSAIKPRHIEIAIAVALFVVTLSIYLKTLCPTIFTDDCGEITTAVATGGVIHPPGYPLYTLIGGWLIHAIPHGEPAWRLGLLSALSASGAVVLSYFLTRRTGAGRIWSVAAALTFGFSIALWQQATKVETYALNAFLVALVLLMAARCEETRTRRKLIAAAFCCGLALTNHMTAICAVAGAAWLIYVVVRDRFRQRLAMVAAGLAFVAPLGLYALVWIAASHHPGGQIWGDPSNWRRFILHVTGARYQAYLSSQSGASVVLRDGIDLPALLWQNLGLFLIGVVPGAARGLLAASSRRQLTIALLIACAAYGVETSLYGISNIFEYYTPLVLLLCILASGGWEAILFGIAKRVTAAPHLRLRPVSALCCALLGLTALVGHWSSCDHSRATFIRGLALNTLSPLPPNAVVIVTGDNRLFPLWYAQDVLGVRRDVTAVPRHMLDALGTEAGRDEMGWLVDKMAAQHPDLVDAKAILSQSAQSAQFTKGDGPAWTIAARALMANRAVFISDLQPADTHADLRGLAIFNAIGPDLAALPAGLLDQITPAAQWPDVHRRVAMNLAIQRQTQFEYAPDALMQNEPDGNLTNSLYGTMLDRNASLLTLAGNHFAAYEQLKVAVAYDPCAQNLADFGAECARTMHMEDAVASLRKAVDLAPGNITYQNELSDAQQQMACAKMTGAAAAPTQ